MLVGNIVTKNLLQAVKLLEALVADCEHVAAFHLVQHYQVHQESSCSIETLLCTRRQPRPAHRLRDLTAVYRRSNGMPHVDHLDWLSHTKEPCNSIHRYQNRLWLNYFGLIWLRDGVVWSFSLDVYDAVLQIY